MMTISKSNKGFTLIELLIATTIFTFILLIATAGIVRIGQLYYKSLNQSKTQDATRAISEELTRSVQFAKGSITPYDTGDDYIQKFCLGDTVYTVFVDKPYLTPDNPADNNPDITMTGLWSQRLNQGESCACIDPSCYEPATQLLGENTRVLKIDVSQLSPGIDAWRVDMRIAYGDNDLLTHYDDQGDPVEVVPAKQLEATEMANCKSGYDGGSFCATAQLDTVVKKRLN